GAARLAVMDAPLDAALARELRARAASLASALVVRSSSELEAAGRWAGAFTSYVGITPDQIDVAVRGCWASVYSRDVLERCENEGVDPRSLRLAVLVQPAIEFEAGGAARHGRDGAVHVTATRGSPAQLMTGWVAGEEIVVESGGSVPESGSRVVGAEGLVAVAALARDVHKLLDDDLIEWGWTPQVGALLLQSKRAGEAEVHASAPAPHVPAASRESADAIAAIRLARLVRRFSGWLAEEAILPWAILLADEFPEGDVAPAQYPAAEARDAVRELGRKLAASAWGVPETEAFRTGLQALEAVRTAAAGDKLLERIRRGVRLDSRLVARAFGLFAAAEQTGGTAKIAPARDRWEPFVFSTVQRYGERRPASGVVEGIGAGRARYVDAPSAAPPSRDRKVLIVPQPLASFAPLLWNAAGLVTIAGGAGAHLMEIAHSLAVPTVMRCRLDDIVAEGAERFLLAVDGDAGCVSMLPLRG
ncbi:MAG: PEP/pyruvate-binding domain-containing protein, partial [Vulcanimicrobiaceae bacterium]